MRKDLVKIIRSLPSGQGFDTAVVEDIEPLTPDGSLRRFYRIHGHKDATAVAILPPPDDEAGRAEAEAAWRIGRHLTTLGVPVPRPYGFSASSGLLLCEDLGDVRLHDLVCDAGTAAGQVRRLYREAVAGLARMQVHGGHGLNPSWCWDGARYDRQLMLERESGYFLQALCRDFLGLTWDGQAVSRECRMLAEAAARAPADFFLHRDFQSRNIMVFVGRPRFIDFQAGRRGPLAYDMASLLLDPYAGLGESFREELLEHYLDVLTGMIPYDRLQFHREFLQLGLQRNLQILGAFAFLIRQRGKVFFRRYLRPALASLQTLLAKPAAARYPCLRRLTDQCSKKLYDLHDL